MEWGPELEIPNTKSQHRLKLKISESILRHSVKSKTKLWTSNTHRVYIHILKRKNGDVAGKDLIKGKPKPGGADTILWFRVWQLRLGMDASLFQRA